MLKPRTKEEKTKEQKIKSYWRTATVSVLDKDLTTLGKCYFALKALNKPLHPEEDDLVYEPVDSSKDDNLGLDQEPLF